MNKSPTGKLSVEEATKSIRDIIVPSVGAMIPQILEVVQITDFGEYTFWVSILCAAIAPAINRILNLWRI